MTVAPPPFKRCAASSVRRCAVSPVQSCAVSRVRCCAVSQRRGKREKRKMEKEKKEKGKGNKKREPGDFSSSSPLGGDYLLSHFRSTIGVVRLNFSVRNGKRWDPHAIIT